MAHAWINIVYMKDEDFKVEQDKRKRDDDADDGAAATVAFSGGRGWLRPPFRSLLGAFPATD